MKNCDFGQIRSEISLDERADIDRYIDIWIKSASHRTHEISRAVFECITALTGSEAKKRELEQRGILKRILGEFTGSNRKLQNQSDHLLIKSQYGAIQLLEKLAEQNLMTLEMAAVLNNKLNTAVIDHNRTIGQIWGEFNDIYDILGSVFDKIKQLENRVDNTEYNIRLLKWNQIVEYQKLGSAEYSQLQKEEKLLCLVYDFYMITAGKWEVSDLILLKSTMKKLNLEPSEKTSYREVHDKIKTSAAWTRILAILPSLNQGRTDWNPFFAGTMDNDEAEHIGADKDITFYDLALEILFDINFIKSEEFSECLDEKMEEAEKMFLSYSMNEAYDLLLDLVGKEYVRANYFLAKFMEDNYKNIRVSGYGLGELLYEGWQRGEPLCASVYLRNAREIDKRVQIESFKQCKSDLRMLAENGDVFAAYELGLCYISETDEPMDYHLSAKWFEKAADSGYWKAYCSLGISYLSGRGVETDVHKAWECLKKAAEVGYSSAQYMLGVMYKNGSGTKCDELQAVRWFTKAADQGNQKAKKELVQYIRQTI